MCYDIKTMLKRQIQYCSRYFPDSVPALIKQLEPYLEPWEKEQYHASGFTHPRVYILTNIEEQRVELANWGLIPGWAKDKETAESIWNKTINCRAETMFEKPSFRDSAKKRRCVIFVDGFYEHHHKNDKVYPFYIYREDEEMIPIAGLWSEWTDKETGEIRKTFTIITTKANKLLKKVHKNPKQKESRMPWILLEDEIEKWLDPEAEQKELEKMVKPYPDKGLTAHPVQKLRGKDYPGNVPEITEEVNYPELNVKELV